MCAWQPSTSTINTACYTTTLSPHSGADLNNTHTHAYTHTQTEAHNGCVCDVRCVTPGVTIAVWIQPRCNKRRHQHRIAARHRRILCVVWLPQPTRSVCCERRIEVSRLRLASRLCCSRWGFGCWARDGWLVGAGGRHLGVCRCCC
jgi:hypothetical protein